MMRIMIVEDDFLIALDMERTLRMAEHEIIGPAATAEMALKLAEAEHPDLALIDIRLADGDSGPALARELWDRYLVASLFVTANMTDNPAWTDAALGVLAKPASPVALFRSVNVVRRIIRDEPVDRRDMPNGLRLFVS